MYRKNRKDRVKRRREGALQRRERDAKKTGDESKMRKAFDEAEILRKRI